MYGVGQLNPFLDVCHSVASFQYLRQGDGVCVMVRVCLNGNSIVKTIRLILFPNETWLLIDSLLLVFSLIRPLMEISVRRVSISRVVSFGTFLLIHLQLKLVSLIQVVGWGLQGGLFLHLS